MLRCFAFWRLGAWPGSFWHCFYGGQVFAIGITIGNDEVFSRNYELEDVFFNRFEKKQPPRAEWLMAGVMESEVIR
jgi:hypothetical protein